MKPSRSLRKWRVIDMTIDEAIAMMHEWADYDCYNEEQIQASEAFNQIAVLLEELKFRRVLQLQCEKEFFAGYEKGKKEEYNKAIDDFVKEICKMIVQSENNGNYRFYAVEIKQAIADLAEQLKAGEGE